MLAGRPDVHGGGAEGDRAAGDQAEDGGARAARHPREAPHGRHVRGPRIGDRRRRGEPRMHNANQWFSDILTLVGIFPQTSLI